MIGGLKNQFASMRHRVEIQNPVETQDAALQPITTWETFRTSEPASYEQTAGGEVLRGRQVAANVTCVFVVNYRTGYSTRQRVIFDGTTHEILRVHTPDGIKRFVELECRAVGV